MTNHAFVRAEEPVLHFGYLGGKRRVARRSASHGGIAMSDERLDLEPGRVLAGTPYQIVRLLGRGGMGAVYEAKHERLKRRVAVKVLLNDGRSQEDNAKRIEREGETLARLAHPHIVMVHDLGVTDDGLIYLVMEFLNGSDLRRVLNRGARFEFAHVLALAEELLDALAYAHREGIVHRDVKPENIFLVDGGSGELTVKLLDFGIARIRARPSNLTGDRYIGTPYYSSPEQIRNLLLSEKSDIYSVGCVLFELLAGRRPFVGSDMREVLLKHLHDRAPRVSELVEVPKALDDIVARMLEKDPEHRPTSALWCSHQLSMIRRSEQGVVLAEANTTQRTALTALTEAGPSSERPGPLTPSATIPDPGAAKAEALANDTQPCAPPFVEGHEEGTAPIPQTSPSRRMRRAATREGEAPPREQPTEKLQFDTHPMPVPEEHAACVEALTGGSTATAGIALLSNRRPAPIPARQILAGSMIVSALLASLALVLFLRQRSTAQGARPEREGPALVASASPPASASIATASLASSPAASTSAPAALPLDSPGAASTTSAATVARAAASNHEARVPRSTAAPSPAAVDFSGNVSPTRAPGHAAPQKPSTSTISSTSSPGGRPTASAASSERDDYARTIW